MLMAAWPCPFNGAAPASLLRYGLRYRSNSGFAGTEPAEAPYARTGMKTHDGTTVCNSFETLYSNANSGYNIQF